MQTWYNEAVARSNDGGDHLIGADETTVSTAGKTASAASAAQASASEEAKGRAAPASAAGGKAYGEDGYRYP